MNKYLFLILWSLVSPFCLGLIVKLNTSGWNPGSGISILAIALNLAYWVLLGILQAGLLFWEFKDKQLSWQWFLKTSITGFFHQVFSKLTQSAFVAGKFASTCSTFVTSSRRINTSLSVISRLIRPLNRTCFRNRLFVFLPSLNRK